MEAAAFWFVQFELQLAFGERETAAFGEARWGSVLTFVHCWCIPCRDLVHHTRAAGTRASRRPLVFPSGIAQFDELLDGGTCTICSLCACRPARGLLWTGVMLHSMHPAFCCILHSSHSCIPTCQCYILHSLSQYLAFLASAPHAFCMPFLHCSRRCVPEGREQDKRAFCIPCSPLGIAPKRHFAPGLTGVIGLCPAVQEYVLVGLRSCAL